MAAARVSTARRDEAHIGVLDAARELLSDATRERAASVAAERATVKDAEDMSRAWARAMDDARAGWEDGGERGVAECRGKPMRGDWITNPRTFTEGLKTTNRDHRGVDRTFLNLDARAEDAKIHEGFCF